MDQLDIFVLFGLEWLSDMVEERYGERVAWWFTLSSCLIVLAALVGLIFVIGWALHLHR